MIRVERPYARAAPEHCLVDRVWLRGRRKADLRVTAWLGEPGLSTDLRTWFGHDPARWQEFQRRYRRELKKRPNVLAYLLDTTRRANVTRVYGARDQQHNQAVVIRQILEERLR